MISESKLVSVLVRTLKFELPGYVILKHNDPITAGIPDITVTGRGRTTWLEVKLANPRIIQRQQQQELVKRLALRGSCYYVVYRIRTGGELTEICDPCRSEDAILSWVEGINHQMVANFIRRVHA